MVVYVENHNLESYKKWRMSMLFSQKIGKKPIKIDIQFDSMDDDLRIALWNKLHIYIWEGIGTTYLSYTYYEDFIKCIWMDFFKYPLDRLDDWFPKTFQIINTWYFGCQWYEVYDFIEFIARIKVEIAFDNKAFIEDCNKVLEKEVSGYRFISDTICPITDNNEIKGIEDALRDSDKIIFKGAHTHLSTALSMLTDRKSPDYRNSIKESISAVESISKIISGDTKADLNKALKSIEDKVYIHSALKMGFTKIYGYTSDESGIRHAMFEEKDITFADAKYMLVSCSAFISYLIDKANKANLFL